MKYISFLVAFLLCFLIGTTALAQEIKGMRLASSTADAVRFVADLSAEAQVLVSRLSNPPRLILDFKNTTFSPLSKAQKFSPVNFVGGLRTGTPFAGTARIVLDLPNEALTEKHFLLKPQSGKSWRFVLDLSRNAPTVLPVSSSETKTGSGGLRPFTTPKKTQRVIVLDAGHGGQDPGAISRSGHYEKNITLNMVRETRDLLQKAGYKVVLTRDSDVFIPLRGRIKKAHAAHADLFISIHADSAKNPSARGLSVYTISERASDAEAAALAERENKADIILGMDLSEVDADAGNILLDLAKTDTMNKSAQYADLVVREMKRKVPLVPNAHRMAGFVVLKSPNIPSVLVELGYLSNRTEDKNLQKTSYRRDLAEALVRAVNTYFDTISE